MAGRASLAARIRALEQTTGSTSETTVLIRHFGPDGAVNEGRLAEGTTVLERVEGEDAEAFRARAVAALRRGRRGLVVLREG